MPVDVLLIGGVLGIGFYMAWTIGANDVANSMGTSVGSGALTFRRAVLAAAIFELLGAVVFGSHVTDTIRKGIVSPEAFAAQPQILLIGMLSCLAAAALWLHMATFFAMPVSTTHAIVGAVVGFGLITTGWAGISWGKIGQIVSSWILSPLVGGLLSYFIFSFLNKNILRSRDPLRAAIRTTPLVVFIVFSLLVLAFLHKGLRHMHLAITFTQSLGLAFGLAALCAVVAHLLVVRVKRRGPERPHELVELIYKHLQVITACYVAFAHGANDVANAVGPVAAAVSIATTGTVGGSVGVPVWLLVMGGVGIVAGLATFGLRVIETIGKDITQMTPTRGFSAEFAAATTVLVCSRLGLPVSTTHTLVGAVIGVGFARGIGALNFRVVRSIVVCWLVTVPVAAVLSTVIFLILRWLVAG